MEEVHIFRRGGISIMHPRLAVQDWHAKFQHLENIVDGLGHGLDSGIKRTVLAFQLMGLKTVHSCEGHANWAMAAPVVRFECWAPLPAELRAKFDAETISDNEYNRIWREFHVPHYAKIYWHLKQQWLNPFYENRLFDSDIAIGLTGRSIGHMDISSLSSGESSFLPPTERDKLLIDCRQEMDDFTDFVLDKLFEGNIPQQIQDLPRLTEQPLKQNDIRR
tara:strand:+ start:116 stop:775 length:660 start_codon:yes stop_codon:yes gene_type:complete